MGLTTAGKSPDRQADIVIIGGGGAGLSAALTAFERGCKSVVLLEKQPSPGGSTVMAHDIFGVESPVQKRAWFDTSRDEMFKTHMEWTHWTVNPRIVRAFIDKSGDTIAWLEGLGLNFRLMPMYPNQSPLIRHSIEGRGIKLIKVLRENAESRGLKLLTRTRAKKILRAESGEVTGVLAENADGEITIGAKTVIITTGGYGGNREMLKKYYPHYKESMTYDPPRTNTGDGIVMAIEAGADTAGLGALNLHGPAFLPRSGADMMEIDDALDAHGNPLKLPIMMASLEPDTIWVNKLGERFTDEGRILQFFAHGYSVVRQPEGIGYTIYDSELVRLKEKEGIYCQPAPGWHPHDTYCNNFPLPGFERELSKGNDKIKIADSWDEIAVWMGADPAALKATVDEYNVACDQGYDPLFNKDRKYLRPLRKPPFYAIEGHAMIADTVGGIKINEKMEVIDTEGRPIPGLLAAGTTTGEWEAEAYDYHLTGHLVGFAINSGRIAGETAMAYLAG